MAEVLPPPMQSPSTISMLHTRPSSTEAFQGSQQQYPQPQRLAQAPRSMYNSQNSSYRGASAPVQPYAFQSTPHLRQDSRTSSAPSTSQGSATGLRPGHAPSASASSTSSDASSLPSTKDDRSLAASRSASALIDISSQLPDLTLTAFDQPAKPSPDRYRRPAQKRVDSNNNNNVPPRAVSPSMGSEAGATPPASQQQQQQQQQQHQQQTPPQTSADDTAVSRAHQSEIAKRYRRRSLNQLDTRNSMLPPQAVGGGPRPSSSHTTGGATSTPTTIRPSPFGETSSSTDGEGRGPAASSVTTPPPHTESSNDGTRPRNSHKLVVAAATTNTAGADPKPASSSAPQKRLAAPSPLSRQANDPDTSGPAAPSTKPKTYAAAAQSAMNPSPAAAQLAALSDKDLNKGMKSRLRRAFSFSGAQELRRAAGENNQAAAQHAQQTREQHQQNIDDELDAEQLEIARRQEAAGIGAGIYSGQGGFSGSTDNLSISSTASSASMMLRKMGHGAKKGARSIKGLFRPKSVIGVPAADGPVQAGSAGRPIQASVTQVSMITVEAERQNVNVNAHAEDMVGGGTGFPKLERNSIDAAAMTAPLAADMRGSAAEGGSDPHSRRSIVGNDRDRAEVLAAVKKGILKRSGTASPSGSPVIRPHDSGLQPVPAVTDSPSSSVPSTPKDGGPPARSASMTNVNGDYFSPSLASMTKSMPNTPNGSIRTITFSPRIQFHDAWSSTEYDRRGEIATCNRLTPMLAQQIKEELNTFKMEMEVHELSKPHTHFF